MDDQVLRYEVKDAIVTITLNRLAADRARDLAMDSEFFTGAIRPDADLAVRCVVVTGSGSAFCTGG